MKIALYLALILSFAGCASTEKDKEIAFLNQQNDYLRERIESLQEQKEQKNCEECRRSNLEGPHVPPDYETPPGKRDCWY